MKFAFGKNWAAFLRNVDEEIVTDARRSLEEMLGRPRLDGVRFLDAGSGSGLFSLAARQMGAVVHSFDLDEDSVACTRELKRRFAPDDPNWIIERGSVLDEAYLESLGTFDSVYSWGVLHHTGDLWRALGNVCQRVSPEGLLFVAIYNDQGSESTRWTWIKRLYNQSPRPLRPAILAPALLRIWGPTTVRDLLRGRPFHTWRSYPRTSRGMSPWYDLIDWVGGYPFEVARPEQVIDFCRERGFESVRMKTCGRGRGCNEFVFDRL